MMQRLRLKKKKYLLLSLLGVLVIFSIGLYKLFPKNTFCVPIPIQGYTDGNAPFVHVEIEGKQYPFILDLGFNGVANLNSECLEKIEKKTFIKKSRSISCLGKEYEQNLYEIPELKISNLKFHPIRLGEQNKEFLKDSVIIPARDKTLVKTVGSLGCGIFNSSILCLDLKFSMLAVCDSFETFKKELHPIGAFIRIPLFNEHDVIEFEIETPKGKQRCILDSGFTYNCLNVVQTGEKPLDQFITDDQYATVYETFQIGGKNFGPITFHAFPINFPFHVDAILGREFLATHVVVIDFINHEIYIANSVKKED